MPKKSHSMSRYIVYILVCFISPCWGSFLSLGLLCFVWTPVLIFGHRKSCLSGMFLQVTTEGSLELPFLALSHPLDSYEDLQVPSSFYLQLILCLPRGCSSTYGFQAHVVTAALTVSLPFRDIKQKIIYFDVIKPENIELLNWNIICTSKALKAHRSAGGMWDSEQFRGCSHIQKLSSFLFFKAMFFTSSAI